jgi:NAD(P)-dependent dehydrogenase (short-subunit alcohol dehydrogenase family)
MSGVPADVADQNAVSELFDQAERAFGGIDVVNAAGAMTLARLVDFDLAVLDRTFPTNIRGTFVVDQQAARRLRAGRGNPGARGAGPHDQSDEGLGLPVRRPGLRELRSPRIRGYSQ